MYEDLFLLHLKVNRREKLLGNLHLFLAFVMYVDYMVLDQLF